MTPNFDCPILGSVCAATTVKVATYADLKSLFEDPDGREPGRTVELT